MPKSIFIVEDEPDTVELYTEIVELYGYEVVDCANNGLEAVAKFANMQRKPDIIIMDHRMPLKGGIEASKEILELEPGTRIIFASADYDVEPEAKRLGINTFLKKPFSLQKLIHELENI